MRFLDAWTELPFLDLIRWLLPAGFMVALVLLPGRAVARAGALGTAIGLLASPELLPMPWLRAGWAMLWAILAWRLQSPPAPGSVRRAGIVETGTVGLLLALALLGLLFTAIARQDLPHDDGRRASYGLLVLCLGLLHLMLRRHTVRAALALAMLGLGLQIIEQVARQGVVLPAVSSPFAVLIATALAAALAVRVGRTRERLATSPWVSDAHDLHD